ncbi:MAG TPA: ShlB/FhaC/HecB family hemolysin secretion/activation protein [Solimonas sp.]|nr:ShlB/FhaC/HecB family hemolysin secretion/activation protein [Solimonas sp.]
MQMRIRKKTERWALAVAMIWSAGAAAQTTTPGQVGDTLKQPPPLQSHPEVVPVWEPSAAPPGVAGGSRKITVSRFDFAGNTLFSNEALQSIVAGYTNRPVTLLELYAAADRIAAFYADRGYVLASVNVPPQKIEDGVVLLQISEGRIAKVEVDNARLYRPEQIRDELPDVQPGTVHNGDIFRDGLRQLNTLPGLQARAILKPGAEYGTSDMIVRVHETPFAASAAIDNFGRENTGEFRLSATATLNSPLHVEDQLNVIGLVSEDHLLRYAYIDYSLPLAAGARIKAAYSDAEFDVDDAPVDGKNRRGELSVEQTLFAGSQDFIKLSGGVSRTESNADFANAITFISTKITLLELGALWNHSYKNAAVSQISTSISSNFSRTTRAELVAASGDDPASDQRLRWELDAQHLQPLPGQLQLLAHVNGVYSPDPLVDTEAYSLGGPNTVRGFPSAEVRGDRGYFGSLTLRRPIFVGHAQFAGRVFFDAGKVFAVDPLPGSPDHESLTSTGLGVDLAWWHLNARFDWSFPLDNRDISDGRDRSRLFGTLAIAF